MAEIPKSIKASLYIDGKPAEASMKNLRQVTQTLRRELDGLTVGTDAWNKKMLELQAHERTLRNINNEIKGVGGAFGWLKTELGKLGALAVGYLGFQFITERFHNIIQSNAKLSDSLAELRRTANLTELEVMRLNKSFKELDTRTSTEGLREIAVIAGKLGVAKNEILAFTEATDKLVVTLGDELGNADQITTQLGKILNVYEGSVNGDNITKLGNAMVVMANAGVASAGFISEFTQRVSGIAKTANLSLGATIGLAAGLEELGGRSESASTAVSRLLNDIASDLPKAAQMAKAPLAEFQKLFAESPERALIKYAVGLTQNKDAFSEVAASFKDAGEEGSRVVATLAAIGGKSEFMQGKIDLANKSLGETSAINAGFALKNETFGASVDKLGKKFSELSANKGLTGFLQSLILLTSNAIDGINNHSKAVGNFIKILIAGGAAWATYGAYVALANTALFAFMVNLVKGESIMALSRTATIALAGAKALLAGNTAKAAQAMRLMNLTMAANPIGLVVAALAAAVTAVILFTDATNDAAKAEQNFNDIYKQTQEAVYAEKSALERLQAILKDEQQSRENKIAAIKRLREILPDHLKSYSDEEILAGKAKTAIDDYVKSLEDKARAEAVDRKRQELNNKLLELDSNGVDASVWDYTVAAVKGGTINFQGAMAMQMAEKSAKERESLKAQLKSLDENFAKELNDKALNKDAEKPDNSVAGKTLDGLNKKLEDLKKQRSAAIIGSKLYRDLTKEIASLEKEIASYDDKKNTAKEESEAKKRVKELADLAREQKMFLEARLIDSANANQKEIAEEEAKYNKLIIAQAEFTSKKGVTDKQIAQVSENIRQLGIKRDEAVNKIKIRQEEDLVKDILELRASLTSSLQTESQKEVAQINKKYGDLLKKGYDYFDLEAAWSKDIADVKLREEQRFAEEVKGLEAEGVVSEAQKQQLKIARINKHYDDEIEALKKKYSKELQASKEFQDALALIESNRKNSIEQSKQETAAEEKARIRETKDAVVSSAQSVADTVFQIGQNKRQAELNSKLDDLEKERERELSVKGLTEDQKKKINEKYDKEQAKIKLEAWKAQKDADLKAAIIAGALAVVRALPSVPLAIAAGVAAAGQVAVIAAQEPPKFAAGGFSDSDPAGYVSKATIFNRSASGRPFMAGEAGREWIAPNWMLQDPRTANLIGMLEVARQEKRGFAVGGYNNGPAGSVSSPGNSPMMIDLTETNAALAMLVKRFDDFSKKPWEFNKRAFDEYTERDDAIVNRATL